jgi:hypothetical protein
MPPFTQEGRHGTVLRLLVESTFALKMKSMKAYHPFAKMIEHLLSFAAGVRCVQANFYKGSSDNLKINYQAFMNSVEPSGKPSLPSVAVGGVVVLPLTAVDSKAFTKIQGRHAVQSEGVYLDESFDIEWEEDAASDTGSIFSDCNLECGEVIPADWTPMIGFYFLPQLPVFDALISVIYAMTLQLVDEADADDFVTTLRQAVFDVYSAAAIPLLRIEDLCAVMKTVLTEHSVYLMQLFGGRLLSLDWQYRPAFVYMFDPESLAAEPLGVETLPISELAFRNLDQERYAGELLCIGKPSMAKLDAEQSFSVQLTGNTPPLHFVLMATVLLDPAQQKYTWSRREGSGWTVHVSSPAGELKSYYAPSYPLNSPFSHEALYIYSQAISQDCEDCNDILDSVF